jgi:4-aminobutyrate aminotransferase-like enzyme
MGLLQALELVRDRQTREPAPQETSAVMETARENGLLVGKGGTYGNCLRLSPPMNISKTDVDEFATKLDRAFAAHRAAAA